MIHGAVTVRGFCCVISKMAYRNCVVSFDSLTMEFGHIYRRRGWAIKPSFFPSWNISIASMSWGRRRASVSRKAKDTLSSDTIFASAFTGLHLPSKEKEMRSVCLPFSYLVYRLMLMSGIRRHAQNVMACFAIDFSMYGLMFYVKHFRQIAEMPAAQAFRIHAFLP